MAVPPLNRDPDKARAWRERSARQAEQNRRARAAAGETKPLARNRELPRSGRLRSRSTRPNRQAHFAAVAAACAAAIERDGHRCQAVGLVPEVSCWGPLDPQHVIPQGVRPDLAAEVDNIVACCRGHHEWVGDNPLAARAVGLHGRDGDDLAELARLRRGAKAA